MPLHSLWNNSRSLHDYRALPRVREGVVLSCACAQLKLPVSNIERPTLNAERPTSTAGGGARTHTALRPLDFESSASANSATPALLGNSIRDSRISSTSSRCRVRCPQRILEAGKASNPLRNSGHYKRSKACKPRGGPK